jgi:hypothetical protein
MSMVIFFPNNTYLSAHHQNVVHLSACHLIYPLIHAKTLSSGSRTLKTTQMLLQTYGFGK